jgi:hypothetical protein
MRKFIRPKNVRAEVQVPSHAPGIREEIIDLRLMTNINLEDRVASGRPIFSRNIVASRHIHFVPRAGLSQGLGN